MGNEYSGEEYIIEASVTIKKQYRYPTKDYTLEQAMNNAESSLDEDHQLGRLADNITVEIM